VSAASGRMESGKGVAGLESFRDSVPSRRGDGCASLPRGRSAAAVAAVGCGTRRLEGRSPMAGPGRRWANAWWWWQGGGGLWEAGRGLEGPGSSKRGRSLTLESGWVGVEGEISHNAAETHSSRSRCNALCVCKQAWSVTGLIFFPSGLFINNPVTAGTLFFCFLWDTVLVNLVTLIFSTSQRAFLHLNIICESVPNFHL